MKSLKLLTIFALCFFLIYESRAREDFVTITPVKSHGALSNPLKGFRPDLGQAVTRTYDDILRHYIRWNETTQQYCNGGNHPVGYIGVGTNIEATILDPSVFDDPSKDNSLYYKIEN